MKSENEIKSLFLFSLFANLLFLFVSIVAFVFLIVFAVKNSFDESFHLVAVIIAFVGIFVLLICSVRGLVPIFKDYSSYKNETFSKVKGSVIGFKKRISPDTSEQWNDKAMIRTEGGESIVLHLNQKLEREKTYTFIYLPNTKIAVASEE